MQRVTDVFFDLDHTLWDFERNSALAFEKVLPQCGVEVSLSDFLRHYIPLNLHYWELYRNEKITQEQLRYRRLKDTFDAIGHEVEDSAIEAISNAYIQSLPEYNHLFEGAHEILEYLSKKYKLHIITNGFHEIQQRKLDNSGIMRYFTTVTNSEMAGVKKPNPKIFEFALDLANAECSQSVMIGDCIEADIRGAMGCGIDAIWFTSDIADEIKTVAKLTDLKYYL